MIIHREASISQCGEYRWSLRRRWGAPDAPTAGWIMLNPSTADAELDDPTIRRATGFSRDWGYGGAWIGNLFALRATDPAQLRIHPHPVCEPARREPYETILMMEARRCAVVVAAWGAHGSYQRRGRAIVRLMRHHGIALKCLGVTKDGHPKHPLYLPKAAKLVDFY